MRQFAGVANDQRFLSSICNGWNLIPTAIAIHDHHVMDVIFSATLTIGFQIEGISTGGIELDGNFVCGDSVVPIPIPIPIVNIEILRYR